MSIVNNSQRAVSNGTTLVTFLSSPGAAVTRCVSTCVFFNADTVSHVFILYVTDSGTDYEIARSGTIATKTGWIPPMFQEQGFHNIAATTLSLKFKLAEATITTECNVLTAYQDQA